MRKTTSALILGCLLAGGGAMLVDTSPILAKGGAGKKGQLAGPPLPNSIGKGGKLSVAGSGNLYPLVNAWVTKYQKQHADIQIVMQDAESTAGISQVADGQTHIEASGAYMSDDQVIQEKLLNIPLAVGAEQVIFNVPEIGREPLHLSGAVLAGIYDGSIHFWDDGPVQALNPSLVKKLPHIQIVPIHGPDGSGDTFVFTQYLSAAAPSWKAGYGTDVTWPEVPGALAADRGDAVLAACQGKAYSIGYLGLTFVEQVQRANLGIAALQNHEGKFVLPNGKSIASAAWTFDHQTPADGRVSMVMAPGDESYPIVAYEYAIVNPKQPDDATAEAVRKFLSWAIAGDGGNDAQYLNEHFTPLPSDVVKISQAQINQIRAVSH